MSVHQDLTARTDLGLTDANATGRCGCGHGGGCACGSHGGTSTAPAATDVVTELSVIGMTCAHCVKSVTEELAEIYGVNGVDVTLQPEGASTVRVLSEAPLDKAHVSAAIEDGRLHARAALRRLTHAARPIDPRSN